MKEENKPGVGKTPAHACFEDAALLDSIPTQVWFQTDPETYGPVNAAHAAFMGRPKEELEGRKLCAFLSPEETAVCRAANEQVFRTKLPVSGEEWVKDGRGELRLLRIDKMPKLNASGDTAYLVCAAIDITGRARAEEALKYRDRFEKLIADISASLINLPAREIDGWINSALRLIGEFEGVDRSYVFRFNEAGTLMTNTHEWCAAGVEPQLANLKDIPSETLPWWMMKLKANEDVNIPSVAALPPEAHAEKEILEPQSIQSLLVVPIHIESRVEGFLGFDSVKTARTWSPESAALVRMSATLIGSALARKHAEESRLEYEGVLRDVAAALTNRGADYSANIANLTALAGWLMRADMAAYVRMEKGLLRAAGKWKTPEGYRDLDKPEGHIAGDLLGGSGGDIVVIEDLAASRYSESDPVVRRYGYRSYAGCRVKGAAGGTLGVVGVFYQGPHKATRMQRTAMALLAQAISSEEARREAIEKLEDSEARWQFALEGAGDGMWDWDAQTNKVFFSWRWKEMLGYSGPEIGDSLDDWSRRVHPDDLPGAQRDIQLHLDGKTPFYSNEHRMKCKDGSWKWILDRGKVIARGPDGKPLRVIGSHSDIDGRKKMENDLKEAVAKLTTLMENMQAGLLVETPERRVMFANRKFCEFFSIPAAPEDLVGADCAAAAEQSKGLTSDPAAFTASILARIRDRKLVSGAEVRMKDGRVLSQDYVPISLPDGRFIGHMWKYDDITAQKELEKVRAEVTHHVNHELRRPITNQVLALDFLKDELAGKLTTEQQEILNSALTAATGMTRMVEDLLEVTRAETGKLSIKPEATDLAALSGDLVTGLLPSAKEKGLQLVLTAGDGLPRVMADPARVRQIMGNLIDNAFKFTPEGGKVELALRRSAAQPSMAQVSVSDTGQGMAKADLERIFDRLYQTSNISRKGMKGLGLGLHICKMLVEGQGGRIWVESEKGKGSTFSFTLPFAG
jgi:PAS domain S-box-containing protein